MGFGGDLIWTAAIRTYHQVTGKKPTLVYLPGLTDILKGVFYSRARTPADNPIFRGNPRCRVFPAEHSKRLGYFVNRLFFAFIKRARLRKRFELYVLRKSASAHPDLSPLFHIDMELHSYALRETRDRMIWKPTLTAKDGVLSHFLPRHIEDNQCELYWTDEERCHVHNLLSDTDLNRPFILVEPGTNKEYFSLLRSWPLPRWQQLVDMLLQTFPHIPIAQTGLEDTPLLVGVRDLRGKTSFREAALLTGRSALFLCTEGGLMHGACASGASTVVLWGGLTLPSFACYPDKMDILHHPFDCAPCGRLGKCEYDVRCMNSITVQEVFAICKKRIEAL
jgi:hypothetical protein